MDHLWIFPNLLFIMLCHNNCYLYSPQESQKGVAEHARGFETTADETAGGKVKFVAHKHPHSSPLMDFKLEANTLLETHCRKIERFCGMSFVIILLVCLQALDVGPMQIDESSVKVEQENLSKTADQVFSKS